MRSSGSGFATCGGMLPGPARYSWFSTRNIGFRIEHAFLSHALADCAGTVRYSHDERIAGLSDHAPLILELATRENSDSLPARQPRTNGSSSARTQLAFEEVLTLFPRIVLAILALAKAQSLIRHGPERALANPPAAMPVRLQGCVMMA